MVLCSTSPACPSSKPHFLTSDSRPRRNEPAARNTAVARPRQNAQPRVVPRTLADAKVQTSFRLLDRSSPRPTGNPGSSTRTVRVEPLPSEGLPGSSAPRPNAPTVSVTSAMSHSGVPGPPAARCDAPGPSTPRFSAPGPSSSRLDAPCPATPLDIPGPSARRTAATPGGSSGRELSRGPNMVSCTFESSQQSFIHMRCHRAPLSNAT